MVEVLSMEEFDNKYENHQQRVVVQTEGYIFLLIDVLIEQNANQGEVIKHYIFTGNEYPSLDKKFIEIDSKTAYDLVAHYAISTKDEELNYEEFVIEYVNYILDKTAVELENNK